MNWTKPHHFVAAAFPPSLLTLATLWLSAPAATSQQRATNANASAEYTRAHYTKHDYRIPMRDGTKLFTTMYVPKDAAKPYPILMMRTPYSVGPYGIDNYRATLGPSEAYGKEGFIFVYQDARGRYLSEGTFVDVPFHKSKLDGPKDFDESTDSYDTIDWLVKHVHNNNGRVGIYGISYPGFYAAFSLINSHPALKAVSPQAPMGDVGNGDDAYHNGAFFLAANFGFYTGFKPRGPKPERPRQRERFDFGTPDEYDFYLRLGPLANAEELYMKHENEYWIDMVQHPAYDEFWSSRALAPHMKNITAAVLFVGGWYDAEDLSGPLKLFRAVEADGHAPANTLVMGPWPHGGWSRGDGDKLGNLNFPSKTGEYFRDKIELPFFVRNLKTRSEDSGKDTDSHVPKAWVFETGTGEWRKFDAWPPANAEKRSLHLGPRGKLSFDAPDGKAEEYDEYVSDPASPVPVIGEIGSGMPGDYMTHDQRFAARRTDVLTYQTEPLEEDVTICGPVTPVLRVSTSGTDSDFDVKLIDVFPNDYPEPDSSSPGVHLPGYQQLVRGEPFRGKYRNSMSRPESFKPGEPAKIEFVMPDVLHTFRPGHRIMVQIQSSWFPLTDRNPQQFLDIPSARDTDFQKATERVYRGGPNGTRLDVLVVK
jgi:putative CocE/NonD family hydrolase